MVIVVGGMIGVGKTTVAELIAKELNTEVFYEKVSDNPLLKKFYTASKEDEEKYRYPFLLQLYFLNQRFKTIKKSLYNRNNVLDRSIYEDWYFAKVNHDMGRISSTEFSIYESLLDNMMQELKGLPQKAPNLMVYLKCSFDTVIDHIEKRGRSFESEGQRDYFYKLWSGYDNWVDNYYKASEKLIIDMDKLDVVLNEKDKQTCLNAVKERVF